MLQRVDKASVTVDSDVVGSIGRGILILLGVEREDSQADIDWIVYKTTLMRMFDDADGKMNLSVMDIGGEVLVVSQFTLCADVLKGRRPGFSRAAEPAFAEKMYNDAVDAFRARGVRVSTGKFAAMMDVALVNSGPVTFLLDSKDREPPK